MPGSRRCSDLPSGRWGSEGADRLPDGVVPRHVFGSSSPQFHRVGGAGSMWRAVPTLMGEDAFDEPRSQRSLAREFAKRRAAAAPDRSGRFGGPSPQRIKEPRDRRAGFCVWETRRDGDVQRSLEVRDEIGPCKRHATTAGGREHEILDPDRRRDQTSGQASPRGRVVIDHVIGADAVPDAQGAGLCEEALADSVSMPRGGRLDISRRRVGERGLGPRSGSRPRRVGGGPRTRCRGDLGTLARILLPSNGHRRFPSHASSSDEASRCLPDGSIRFPTSCGHRLRTRLHAPRSAPVTANSSRAAPNRGTLLSRTVALEDRRWRGPPTVSTSRAASRAASREARRSVS